MASWEQSDLLPLNCELSGHTKSFLPFMRGRWQASPCALVTNACRFTGCHLLKQWDWRLTQQCTQLQRGSQLASERGTEDMLFKQLAKLIHLDLLAFPGEYEGAEITLNKKQHHPGDNLDL